MLANGTHGINGSGNGNGNGIRTLECPSDYPAVDIQPIVPVKPAWPDHLARYTHSLTGVDADRCGHSLTIRSDTLEGLLSDLKLIKQGIRQAKQKHAVVNPGADRPVTPPTQQADDVQHCRIHNVDMIRRWSKRTSGHYFGHKCSDGSFCYGKAKS